jgi:pimeloyl-ACP methyl ester carboxylesterase
MRPSALARLPRHRGHADRVAGAERVTMAGAGHLLNLERPAMFTEIVLRFLQNVKPI